MHTQTINITLDQPGQGRCHCGALLCVVRAPSEVELKCRRCARVVRLRLSEKVKDEGGTMNRADFPLRLPPP